MTTGSVFVIKDMLRKASFEVNKRNILVNYLLCDTDINAAYNRLWNHANSGLSMTVGFRFGSLCSLRMVH